MTDTNLNDTIISSLHTAENVEEITYAVQKLNYFTGGWHDAYLDGTLNANDRYFTINNATLRIGVNLITFTAEFENGNTIENSFYVVFYDENNLDNNDSDSDGLSNWNEEFYDTDKNDSDTDNDGISDYFEINNSNTNPLVTDTDENGVTDSAEDFDQDGLTNLQEQQHNTDCYSEDTDGDELSDSYETTTTYTDYDTEIGNKTSSTKADTDGDGVNDGLEVKTLKTNPVKYDSTFTHTFTAPTRENAVATPSVLLSSVDGATISSFEMELYESDFYLTPNTPGYIDKAYNFTVDDVSVLESNPAKITFTFDESLLENENFEPAIYYWNEEEQYLEKLTTQPVEDENGNIIENMVYTTVTHFSTYVLLNGYAQDEVWDRDFVPNVKKSEDGGTIKVETVLLIDNSGSMSEDSYLKSDPNGKRKTVATDFAGYILGNNTTTKEEDKNKVAVLSFGEEVGSVNTGFSTNYGVIENAIGNMVDCPPSDNAQTLMAKGINDALDLFVDNQPNDTIRYIMMFTDGVGTDAFDLNDDEDKNGKLDFVEKAEQKGVQIITFAFGSKDEPLTVWAQQSLRNISKITGGSYYYCSVLPEGDEFETSELVESVNFVKEKTQETIEEHTSDDKDNNECGFSDSQLKDIFDEDEKTAARLTDGTLVRSIMKDDYGNTVTKEMLKNGGADYDGDGLDNNKELIWTHIYDSRNPMKYGFVMISNPVRKDTDGDGINDKERCSSLLP